MLLYQGARVTIVTAIVLMMTFVSRHDLSAKAQEDLVGFLNLLLPADSIFPESLQKVKNFVKCLTFDQNTSLDPIFFCKHCRNYNGSVSDTCTSCGKNIENEDHFVTLNVLEQLKSIVPESLQKVKNFVKSLTFDQNTSLDPVFFCKHCRNYNGSVSDTCTSCGKNIENEDHFVTLNVLEQLKSIVPECLKDIKDYQQKQQSKKSDDIEDIQDGQVYKQCFRGSHFIGTSDDEKHEEVHISLQFNTDGVQIFKPSKFYVWPLYFVFNELPPLLRFTRKYRLFGGMWYGKTKPDMDILLQWVKQQATSLFQQGTVICCNGKDMLLRGALLSGVYDLPAKSSVLNFKQLNGFYGCCDCLAEGKNTINLKGTRSRTYPFDMDRLHSGHSQLRTHLETMENATKAKTQGFAELRVKGLTWLGCTPKYDLICSTTVDYMHCVCFGVVKTLIKLWTSKEYKKQIWYIRDRINEIDGKLEKIKPPTNITRLPHTIKDLVNWKASEYRTFLLFYSIPCLLGILPEEHFHHLLCLIHGIVILLSSKISLDNLAKAKSALLRFCASFDIFYHPCFESCNIHSLLHLTDKVRHLGPLWAHSCFFYGDLNKDLRTLFHGTQNIHCQVLTAVRFQQNLPLIAKSLPPGDVSYFYNKLTSYHKIKAPQEFIASGLSSVGKFERFEIKST